MPSTARRRPGRPPAAKADETRKRILRAGRIVFSERGYEGATFQAIAVRADLTRQASAFLDRQPWDRVDLPMICRCLRSTRLPG